MATFKVYFQPLLIETFQEIFISVLKEFALAFSIGPEIEIF